MFIAMKTAKNNFLFKEILQMAVKNMKTKNFVIKIIILKVSAHLGHPEFGYIYLFYLFYFIKIIL